MRDAVAAEGGHRVDVRRDLADGPLGGGAVGCLQWLYLDAGRGQPCGDRTGGVPGTPPAGRGVDQQGDAGQPGPSRRVGRVSRAEGRASSGEASSSSRPA
ncbi:hypothetical protein GCM10011381_03100 [Klenkia taihuensis]|nr:hypothetical protein GCM10011381_03100 [Klenkia taihuensis]